MEGLWSWGLPIYGRRSYLSSPVITLLMLNQTKDVIIATTTIDKNDDDDDDDETEDGRETMTTGRRKRPREKEIICFQELTAFDQ